MKGENEDEKNRNRAQSARCPCRGRNRLCGLLDLLEPGYIISSQGQFDIAYTETDVATGTVEFTFSDDNNKWGDAYKVENGILEFGVCADTGWATKYTGATGLTVGGGFANCTQGAGDNNKATGLEAGKKYVITVQGTADTISVKIDEAD